MKFSIKTGNLLRISLVLSIAVFLYFSLRSMFLQGVPYGLMLVVLLFFIGLAALLLSMVGVPRGQTSLLKRQLEEQSLELRRAEGRFSALSEYNEAIIAIIDKDMRVVFRNEASSRITGREHGSRVVLAHEFLHPEDQDQLNTVITKAADLPGQPLPVTLRIQHKKGHYLFLEGTVVNMLDKEGVEGFVINLRDVSTLKEVERMITKSNRLYYFISQISQMIVKVTDQQTLFNEACRIAVETGKFKIAWIGHLEPGTQYPSPVAYAGEGADHLADIITRTRDNAQPNNGPSLIAISEGKHVVCNDFFNAPETAQWHDMAAALQVQSSISLPIKVFDKVFGNFTVYSEQKDFFDTTEIRLLLETTIDISYALENLIVEEKKRKAEAELVQSEKRYHTLAEVAPVGIFHTDETGYTTYVNPCWSEISGMKRRDALGNEWLKAVHPDDRLALAKGWEEATSTERHSTSEYRFVRPDGSIRWVLGLAVPERNPENKIVGYIGTTTDITERKKAEQHIARLLTEKQTVLNRINDGMISLDREWRYTFLNDAALLIHSSDRDTIIGKVFWDIHPHLKTTIFWDKFYEAMTTGNAAEFEDRYLAINKWFFVKAYPSPDGLTIFFTDITRRKNAEVEIANNEKRFKALLENSTDGLSVVAEDGTILGTSPSGGKILGRENERLPSVRSLLENVHPDDKDKLRSCWNECLAAEGEVCVTEFRYRWPDGSYRWLESSFKNLLHEPYLNAIVLNYRDITGRIKARDEIINEKFLSDSVINSLPGIFYLYNEERVFLRWNRNFAEVTGYTDEEISHMHPLQFFGNDQQPLLAEKIDNTFHSGEDDVQADLLLKSGKRIPYFFTGVAVNYKGTHCLLGVGLDFSGRLEAQQKLSDTTEQLRLLTAHLQKVREEERKRIGREIHDELGQTLTAIKMDIAWLNRKITADDELLRNKLKNVITLLDLGNQSIRRILNELRPGIFEDNGLLEAISWLGRQLEQTTGISVQFTTDAEGVEFPEPIATSLFRIYQETLTNIMRYAEAGSVRSSLLIKEDTILFSVEDDGKGFDPTSLKFNRSFGILGMKERVLSLNGTFELTSSPGKGTTILVILPFQTGQLNDKKLS